MAHVTSTWPVRAAFPGGRKEAGGGPVAQREERGRFCGAQPVPDWSGIVRGLPCPRWDSCCAGNSRPTCGLAHALAEGTVTVSQTKMLVKCSSEGRAQSGLNRLGLTQPPELWGCREGRPGRLVSFKWGEASLYCLGPQETPPPGSFLFLLPSKTTSGSPLTPAGYLPTHSSGKGTVRWQLPPEPSPQGAFQQGPPTDDFLCWRPSPVTLESPGET